MGLQVGLENASPRSRLSPMKPAPENAATPDSRPGTASLQVRPVTARTWQALNAGSPVAGADASRRVSVYTNDLYGQGGPAADDRPRSPQYRPASARPVTPRSAERLQQQVLGSPGGRASPDPTRSPSRLQLSTANVPQAPPRAVQPAAAASSTDSLDSLLARAAKAVAEDAPPAVAVAAAPGGAQQAQQEAAPAAPSAVQTAAGGTAAAAAPAAAPRDPPAGSPAPLRPGTAPVRSAAVSLAALQLGPRSAAPGALAGAARDSPRVFENFAAASPCGGTPWAGAASPSHLGVGARASAAEPGGHQPRPATPSFQPVSFNRPATAAGDFSIKASGSEAAAQEGRSGGGPAAAGAGRPAALRSPYPVPPSTAPAKAALAEVFREPGRKDGLPSYGIMPGTFVAAAPPAGARGEEAAVATALQPLLQADVLAAAQLGTRAGLRQFLLAPGPADKPLRCKIFRHKGGWMKGSHSQYVLVLEEGDHFLLAGRKRKSGAQGAEYTISLDANDLSHKGPAYYGKLRSNFLGTEFAAFDDTERQRAGDAVNARSELVAVAYQTNVLGTKGPRKMTVLIPKLEPSGQRPLKLQPRSDREGMLARYKAYDLKDSVVLRNKPPKWNERLGAYCLNFGGRVTQASVKNFQLVSVDNMERVILQFGKVGDDLFTMDYAYPMTAMQAFAICLSSFDSKLACE